MPANVYTADEVDAKIKTLADAIAKLSKPVADPAPVEPEPEPEPTPEPGKSLTVELYNSAGDEWKNGVSVKMNRIILRETAETKAAFVPGATMTFADGSTRKITKVGAAYNALFVEYDSTQLDPNKVAGKVTLGGAVAPVPKPDEGSSQPAFPVDAFGNVYLNLGLGMGGDGIAGGLPGKHGTHYNFPNLDEWNLAAAQGFKRARVGFLWERAIRGGAGSGQLDEAHMQLMDQTAAWAKQVGMTILWDMHNYTGYSTTNKSGDRKRIGSGVSIEALGNDWKVIARRLESNATTKAVTYGYDLQNEPIIDWDVWKQALQYAVTQVGSISDKVLACEGIAYSSTINWVKLNPGMENITHPKGKQYLEFHGHMYLDERSSGFYTTAQDNKDQFDPLIGQKRIASAHEWAKKHGLKFCVGEINVPGRLKTAVTALDKTLEYCVANGIDTYVFYAARGAGASEHNINHATNKATLDVILKHT